MKAVIAAGHEVTARACAQILQAGGNAFDAVLAGIMVSGLAEYVLSSLGGGGFLMAQVAGRKTPVLYDFFAQTPQQKRPLDDIGFHAIHADFGPATQEFHIGAGATALPGMIPGLFAIHKELCTLPLQQLIAPALQAARQGIEVSAFHAYLFSVIKPILTHSPQARALFCPNGEMLQAGELFRNPDFADFLEALAREGEALFRHGELARLIITQSRDHGGHLTLEDLRDYKVERRAPLVQFYHNHKFYLNPAPSAGGPMIGFALGAMEALCKTHPPTLLDLVEVMMLTNKARAKKTSDLANFANKAHIESQLATVAGHHPSYKGTTHISIIDELGNAASATLSNGEGNGLILPGCGFMLNNMLGEEDLHEGGFHLWKTNQRLSSMMAPTLINTTDNKVFALGSGGSNRIRSALLQVASGLFDHGFTLKEAIEAPRLHTEKSGQISFENGSHTPPFDKNAIAQLLKTYPLAHGWPSANMFFGGVHGVCQTASGKLIGQADPRRDGYALKVTD
ncbi:MAG: gamma-glutamyltransferase [Hyphomicrobiaceae bacterium]|nr:gamma-glutamyltransferase [Hyphomicrobiaceae bacterium]